jgi:hypothetical protein
MFSLIDPVRWYFLGSVRWPNVLQLMRRLAFVFACRSNLAWSQIRDRFPVCLVDSPNLPEYGQLAILIVF